MAKAKPSLYLISVLLFMLVLPVSSIVIEYGTTSAFTWAIIGKWFVFWAVGGRLFSAGLRQVIKPEFTAKEIFNIDDKASNILVKELGFANLCIGGTALLTLLKPEWCVPAAITGGAYFGLAGLLHITKKPASTNEAIALVSDIYIFVIMLLYLMFAL